MTTQTGKHYWDEDITKIDLIDDIIQMISSDETIKTKMHFQKMCNELYKKYKIKHPIPFMAFIERYNDMIADGRTTPSPRIAKVFRKRAVRNQSGIAVISLLTKFWGCPGKCVYCPTFEDLPKSYIPNEPAVMRAQLNQFDPVRQIQNRLRGLRITGHTIDKCDVRII